jgi:hypothetical protein
VVHGRAPQQCRCASNLLVQQHHVVKWPPVCWGRTCPVTGGVWRLDFRLPALMDLYIHPLYVIVSKILSSILNSPAPIHPLYHSLCTLSTVGLTCHFI